MGHLWRSQEMVLAQLYLQTEAAYESVSALGEEGLVQFRDLNPEVNAFQRKYVNEVRRCDEMARKLRVFENEIEKAKIRISDQSTNTATESAAPDLAEIQGLESEFEQLEREIKEINQNEEQLRKQEVDLCELQAILLKSDMFFAEADVAQSALAQDPSRSTNTLAYAPLIESSTDDRTGQLGFVTGVIARDRMPGFERLLWRACRGNVFLRHVEIEAPLRDAKTGAEVKKEVFIVFFQGEQLEARVKKICEGYEATTYPCPSNGSERRELTAGVGTRIQDLVTVLSRTVEHRRSLLVNVASKIGGWVVKVKKVKAIYHHLNMFNIDVTRKALIAECWCPAAELANIRQKLKLGTERSKTDVPAILNVIKTKEVPPTYHKTTKFTQGFQNIVDAYGVASYREINPGPFTIITFPFLFAVMFGDFGHGILMASLAAFLILKEKSLANFKDGGEIWNTMFGGRYIIFLMGLFSIYTGFVYNDVFSKSFSLGESGWNRIPDIPITNTTDKDYVFELPRNNFSYPYVFGIDPVWNVADNKLTFSNSYKMKLSVILGILQMEFGVFLSFMNHRFFKDNLRVIHEFIPQVIFLTFIFGYLIVMIIYKWCMDSFPGNNPPSLLLMLINMFLKFGSKPEPGEVLWGDKSGNTQAKFQAFLVVTAVLCVPWMLLVRPLILKNRHKKKLLKASYTPHENAEGNDVAIHQEEEDEDEGHGHGGHGGEFNFGELMVHQAIHTIEFCLGCISNTASYLRLWALSLAHSQLSEVLWQMVFHLGLSAKGGAAPIMLYFLFGAWAVLTVCVLLIMEGLSAFLHALRLHWVEFQNKFYGGAGYLFAPFHFKRVLTNADE